MKTVIGVFLLVVALAAAGYVAFPYLIDQQTQGLRSDVRDLKQRIQKMEALAAKEDTSKKGANVKSDADLPQIIRAVNTLSNTVSLLEEGLKKGLAMSEDSLKKEKMLLDESLKKQKEGIDKANKDNQEKIQTMVFENAIGRMKAHILKFKEDILSKNIGLAKNELDSMTGAFQKLLALASSENKKTIMEFQDILAKVKSELESDLPAALNRIDLLWHEVNKLTRK